MQLSCTYRLDHQTLKYLRILLKITTAAFLPPPVSLSFHFFFSCNNFVDHRLTSVCLWLNFEGKENGTSDGSGSAEIKSDGGVENKWLGIEMASGLVLFVFLLISPFSVWFHFYCNFLVFILLLLMSCIQMQLIVLGLVLYCCSINIWINIQYPPFLIIFYMLATSHFL